MFQNARLKLTAYYLLIIMVISLAFSLVIYRGVTTELNRVQTMQKIRIESRPFRTDLPHSFFLVQPEVINDATHRLQTTLFIINLAIFTLSAAGGYFLAGRTLKPIADMVERQRRFISDASHELRTPLTALMTETEIALRNKQITPPTRKLLKSNLEEINKLKSLTDYLLSLNRYQNPHKLKLTAFDLSQVVSAATDKLRHAAAKKHILLKLQLKKVILTADQTAISEVVTNLLDNAIKYSPVNSQIALDAHEQNHTAVITIIDRGIGISPEELPHIFDRFYQVEAARNKTRQPGFGLGLAIAKDIITLHRGTISVTSTPGVGSTFTIKLPL